MESSAKKMVTAEEFDAAVKQVIHDQVSDPKLDGMGKLLIPLTGAIFAKDVKKILFGETEENKEDYWYWDAAKETIVMHTKDGRELDIRETKRVEYTTLNILSDEWVLASTKNCPAMGGEATFSFGEAIKYLKRGHKVARKGWNGKKQYIQLASGISYKAPTGDIVNCEHDAIGNMAVAFVGTSGVQMGWLASQADMLADDWVFAE